jgi:acyl-CoA thioester hydrolase
MDLFGHVNNIAYFKYIQAARVNFWDKIGLTEMHQTKNIGPILASCKCDFLKELNYPGNVRIHTSVSNIGRTSFGFTHDLFDEKDIKVAVGQDAIVFYDFNLSIKKELTDFIRDSLAGYQMKDNS